MIYRDGEGLAGLAVTAVLVRGGQGALAGYFAALRTTECLLKS